VDGPPVEAVLKAASDALGTPLTAGADLGGSDRSTVLRCERRGGGTVVIKSYPAAAEGWRGFAAEAAGLAFAGPAGAGPRLLASDASVPLVVMSDLGAAPSLADLLLGESAEAAGAAAGALLSWARACGQLAVRTAGRQRELAALQAAYPAASPVGARHWLHRRIESAPGLAALLGITPPPGLAGDLADVASILAPGGYEVFSPGDICPDNNLMTASGIRFVDFENAEFHSVFLDAAYLRMPFSTCWCVSRLPAELAAAAELAYRAEVSAVFGELADDAVWQAGVVRAMAAWTIHAMTYLLDRSVTADRPMNQFVPQAPSGRQLLRYRWQMLGRELQAAGALPALAALMRSLLAATDHWDVPDLPVYPAFRPLRQN
jgi:hypothetical protein